jgi:hypothetical protein
MPKGIIHARIIEPSQHAFEIDQYVHDVVDPVPDTNIGLV